VACRADSRAAVHVEPDITLVGDLRLPGVDADADADRPRRKADLDLLGRRHGIGRPCECAEERVALGIDFDTVVFGEDGAHQLAVLGEGTRVPVA
jgi:hypothetical protein